MTTTVSQDIRLNRLLVVCFVFGVVALMASLFAQYGWGIAPCRLCNWQRLLTGLVALMGILGLGTRQKKVFLNAAQLTLVLLVGLAIYHLAIQVGWVADPCTVSCSVDSMGDFKRLLNQPAPCSVSPRLLGFPLATYTLLGGGAVLVATFLPSSRGRLRSSHSS